MHQNTLRTVLLNNFLYVSEPVEETARELPETPTTPKEKSQADAGINLCQTVMLIG